MNTNKNESNKESEKSADMTQKDLESISGGAAGDGKLMGDVEQFKKVNPDEWVADVKALITENCPGSDMAKIFISGAEKGDKNAQNSINDMMNRYGPKGDNY
jgi:hypothetical protein